jgi:asparagine synthase (glutamine-hydrolysing)
LTTPEEVGEHQPLKLNGLPFMIVLDGRIDNRQELFGKLNIMSDEGGALSDAALVLRAFAHWGEHCFEHFVGEFSIVIFDELRNEVICARDPLGDRTLFYAALGAQVVIASEPWAVAGATSKNVEINERSAAHYFALRTSENGQTLFKNVNELLPAHVMVINASGERQWRYWQPDPTLRLRGKSDEEYAAQFRLLLEESVRCRMRSVTPVGILMSGGLDSTSVACVAARMLAPSPLTTISYVFDELADCDERMYINALQEQWGTRSIQIPCDDLWPYKDWESWPPNPNQPEGNPYRLLKERAYKRSHDEGLRVMLTGGFGDHLYSSAENWMADLIGERQLSKVLQELIFHLRSIGLRRTLGTTFIRRAARRLLDMLPGGRHLHRKNTPFPWLTSLGKNETSISSDWLGSTFDSSATLLGLMAAGSCTGEIPNASRNGLEFRHPYRDRRLIEFVLSLPAYQLYFHGLYKYILRTAMQGVLPEIICNRLQPTSLLSLFFRGIENEKSFLQNFFQDTKSSWRRFVQPEWVLKRWNITVTPDKDGPQVLVPWLCFSFEAWYKSFIELSSLN